MNLRRLIMGGGKSFLSSAATKVPPALVARHLLKSKGFEKYEVWGGESLSRMMNDGFVTFLTENERKDHRLIDQLKVDIVKCYLQYDINPEEYFLHGFRGLTNDQRKTYMSKKLKDLLVMHQLGSKCDKAFMELKDKYEFYKLAGAFFQRDACGIKAETDYSTFEHFTQNHSRFIAKPIKGRYGSNTAIYNIADYDGDTKRVFGQLMSITDEWIVEELIEQDERMAAWNPTSVNTIRVPSFRTNEGIKIYAPFIRMGRKGSVVDNAGSGGIYATLDAKTGIICSKGMDEKGHVYEANPDNGKVFLGWQCPEWDSLVSISKKVHNSLPAYHKYIGFDFALSTKGWVLVEGNWGDFICQQSSMHKGMKKEFSSLLKG